MPSHYKALFPLRPKANNKYRIFGFDTETLHVHEDRGIKQKFLLGCFYGNGIQKSFTDRGEMSNFLLSHKFEGSMIFASNLDFDWHILFDKSEHIKDFFLIERNGLIFARYKKDKNHGVKFVDTWNYTGKMSVEKMGDFLGYPKIHKPDFLGEKPKDDEQWNELKAYCMRDAEITYRFADFMQGFCNKHNIKFKITLASLGLDFWRRNYQKFPLFQQKRDIVEKIYLGFHGGRVEMFKRGHIDKPVYLYDFNSHYPSCCHDGIDGKGNYPNPNRTFYLKEGNRQYIFEFEGISYVEMNVPYSYIAPIGILSEDNKYIFPYGLVKGYFTNIEIREAVLHGAEILNVGEMIYFPELFIPFRDCIDYLYKKRAEYREGGDLLMSQMIKTIMNGGIFGKFAQKIDEKENIIPMSEVICDDAGILYHNGQQLLNSNIRGELLYQKIKNPKMPIFIQPILSVYTTAIARIRLFRELCKYPQDIVYCDTDSLYILKPRYEDSKKLGELKLEKKCKEAMFILPKLYYYKDEDDLFYLKSKGLPKTIKTENDFLSALDVGSIEMDKWLRYKEAQVRNLEYGMIIRQKKKIGCEDSKRQWEKPFNKDYQDSKPILCRL